MLQTQECIDEIVDIFQSRSAESGPELIDRVMDLYFMFAEQQSVEDQETFGEVMTRMAYASDTLTRARLAERFSKAERAPRNLLQRLACDEIIVARPVLQYSLCLREADLVSIIGQVEEKHLIATAHRQKLSVTLTDLLMKRGGEQVLAAMMYNMGAQFSPDGLVHLTEAAQNSSELHLLLKLRHELAPSPLKRLTQLKRLAEAGFWQGMAQSVLMTEEENAEHKPRKPPPPVKEEIKLDTAAEDPAPQDEAKTDSAERKTTSSNETALLDSAQAGKIEETLEHFSNITQLNSTMLEHCLFDAEITALMVLCKANKLAPGTFRILLKLRESQSGELTSDIVGLLRRYDGMTPSTAQRIIRFSDKRRRLDDAEDTISDETASGEADGSGAVDLENATQMHG